MDFVFTSELQDCDGCCQTPKIGQPKPIHAHMDHALNMLYLFSDTHMFSILLDEVFSHQQHENYHIMSLLGGTKLPDYFQSPNQHIVQIISASQVPFALLTNVDKLNTQQANEKFRQESQNWQTFYVLTDNGTESNMGMLYIAYSGRQIVTGVQTTSPFYTLDSIATNTKDLEYVHLFDNANVLHELKLQIQKRHYEGVDISAQGKFDTMSLQGFTLLNDRKRMDIPENRKHHDLSTTIHLMVSHVQDKTDILQQDNDVLHDQILSFVDIDVSSAGISTVVVKLLTILTHEQEDIPHSFFYTIIPYMIDVDFPNNILGKGVVVSMLQRGNTHTIVVSNFSCLTCGANVYNAITESCSCNIGTVPVCLPCSTDCAAGRFMVEPSTDLCHKAAPSLSERAVAVAETTSISSGPVVLQRYNLICMACTGTFFCRNGKVNGIAQCPATHPITLKNGAAGDYECSCPPGFATSEGLKADYTVHGALLQYNTMVSRLPKKIYVKANETCSKCPTTLLCTPLYTQHDRVILCPLHTTSQTYSVVSGGDRPDMWSYTEPESSDDILYTNIYQGCFCMAGYYRTDYTSETYLLDDANFIYQYSWDNSALQKQSAIGNTKVHLRIELCKMCEAGWACQHSTKSKCEPISSTSTPGSTHCTCRIGFVKTGPNSCGQCPTHSICMGGETMAITCTSQRHNIGNQHYCPCETGYIVNAFTWECQICPSDFYCPGFSNMTGIMPSNTIYAHRCPLYASSTAGSRSIEDCFCKPGLAIASIATLQQTQSMCVSCAAGYYCPGFNKPPIRCPQLTTTNDSIGIASSISDCVCSDPKMQMTNTSITPECVCRAGWLQNRYCFPRVTV